jgi:hypothetical protein
MMTPGDYVQLNMDFMTTVAFVSRQGGTRSRILCQVAKEIWDHVISLSNWLRANWLS